MTALLLEAYDVFISHADEDSDEARRLAEALKHRGLTCWLDKHNLQAGEHYEARIRDGIRKSSTLVLLWSPHAQRSAFVSLEVSQALGHQLPVVPVVLREFEAEKLAPPFDQAMRYQGFLWPVGDPTGTFDRMAAELRRGRDLQRRRRIARRTTAIAVLAIAIALIVGYPVRWFIEDLKISKLLMEEGPPRPAPDQNWVAPKTEFGVYSAAPNSPSWGQPLTDLAVARTGDLVSLRLKPSTPGYLYVIQRDAAGNVQWAFPTNELQNSESFGQNPVVATSEIVLPPTGFGWPLDEHIGTEEFIVVFSATRWPGLEEALRRHVIPPVILRSASQTPSPGETPLQWVQLGKGHARMVTSGVPHEVKLGDRTATVSAIEYQPLRNEDYWMSVRRTFTHASRK